MKVALEDILKARTIVNQVVKKTPLEKSTSASKIAGTEVYFKLENLQHTGSFKIRGAFNKIYNLTPEEKKKGVVAASAGNHAQGVAFSATHMNVKSTVVMPTRAPMIKAAATKGYGADVVLHGDIYDEAFEHAKKLERDFGYTFVHPYEDPLIIAGQGTVGLEILEDLPDVDSIIVAVGGGGWISGVGTAIKAKRPNCKVYAVQTQVAPSMHHMFHKKTDVPITGQGSIADGIAVKKPSQNMFDSFIKDLVDDFVLVSEDEIAESIVFMLERSKLVLEGAAAATLAALFSKQLKFGKKTCLVFGGGNIDLNIIAKVIDRGLIRKGRLVDLEVLVDDVPGMLHRLTKCIADEGANILEVYHDRLSEGLYLRETKIKFVLETKSAEHIQDIERALSKAGARLI